MEFTAEERARLVHSLSTREQLLAVERLSVNEARRWALGDAVAGRADVLTEDFVRRLHRRMFGTVWRSAGRFREGSDISSGVRLALEDADGWICFGTYSAKEAAVRLHHRLMGIHPWHEGNGRHARLLADVVVRSRNEEALSWGAAQGCSAGARYAEAIRVADGGDLSALVAFACG